jgi:hypothetical protein
MGDELAASNVNRSYTLAATSIAIFTFTMIFLYPRYLNGEANAFLFQVTLVTLALATFAFVVASFYFYAASLGDRIDDPDRKAYARRGDAAWLFGYSLLFLAPSLVLFTVNLLVVGAVWLALWLGYLAFVYRSFPRVRTR